MTNELFVFKILPISCINPVPFSLQRGQYQKIHNYKNRNCWIEEYVLNNNKGKQLSVKYQLFRNSRIPKNDEKE